MAARSGVASADAAPGTGGSVVSSTVPAVGDVFIGGGLGGRVLSVPAGGGTPSVIGSGFANPSGVAVDAAGDVFVADPGTKQVVEIHADGSPQSTVGTGFANPSGVAVDAAGDVYVADSTNKQVVVVHADGSPQSTISTGTGLVAPGGVAVDAAGDVYIADTNNDRVVAVHADGSPDSTVGDGLSAPYGVAVDAAGDVFIADSGNGRVVEVHADGSPQSTVGDGLNVPYGVAVDAAGDVFITDAFNNQVVEVHADGSPQSTVASGLDMPVGVAVYAPPPTFVASTPPATATVGAAYSYSYTAHVPTGEPAATFAVSKGTLPPGLTLDPTTGVLGGTPTIAGSYTFTIQTENAANASLAAPVTIAVGKGEQANLQLTSTAGVLGVGLEMTAGGGSGTGAVTFAVADGTAAGCEVSATLPYTLTSSAAGTCMVTVTKAGDSDYESASSGAATVTFDQLTTRVGRPGNGAVLHGSVFMDAGASSNVGVATVTFELSGGPSNLANGVISTGALSMWGYIGGFDTTKVANGTYTIQSVVTNVLGASTTSAPITVTVANSLLTASILIPTSGASMTNGSVLDAMGHGSIAVTSITFEVTGGGVTNQVVGHGQLTLYGWLALMDTSGIAPGSYLLDCVAVDAAGNVATSPPIAITVTG